MSEAKTLKKIEQDMELGSEQQRVDALLDAFEYGDVGLYLMVQTLEAPCQLVRETAYLLLTENHSEGGKQALWNYLPRHLQPLCPLHFLPQNRDYPHHEGYCYWYLYGGTQPKKPPVAYRCWPTLEYVAFTPDEKTLAVLKQISSPNKAQSLLISEEYVLFNAVESTYCY